MQNMNLSGGGFDPSPWEQKLAGLQKQAGDVAAKLRSAKNSDEVMAVTDGSKASREGSLSGLMQKITQEMDALKKNAPEAAQYKATAEPATPAGKVAKAFAQLKTYASNLQNQAEIQLHQQLRADTAAKATRLQANPAADVRAVTGSEPPSIENLCATLKSRGLFDADLPKLLHRHLGAEDRNYSMHDVALVMTMEKELKTEIAKGGEGVENLKKMLELITEVKSSIKNAFKERIALINGADIDSMTQQLSDPDKDLARVCACHDFYWDFHNPLAAGMTFDQFIELNNWIDMTPELAEFFKDIPRNIDAAKLKMLSDSDVTIKIENRAKTYEGLSDQDKVKADAHKMEYLRGKMKVGRAQWGHRAEGAPNVVIFGGGPGGLTHSLAAGISGANVKVIEKRSNYERPMVIQLHSQPLLHYFGIYNRLSREKQLGGTPAMARVQIMHLESAIEKVAKELMGNKVFVSGEPVDIVVGNVRNSAKDKGTVQTICLVKETGQKDVTPFQADMIVDSTGARAAAAKILGVNPAQTLSKPIAMVVVVLKSVKPSLGAAGPPVSAPSGTLGPPASAASGTPGPPVSASSGAPGPAVSTAKPTMSTIKNADYDYTRLPTPNVEYLQIQPKGAVHDKIVDLLEKSEKLKQRLEDLRNQPQTQQINDLISPLAKQLDSVQEELSQLSNEIAKSATEQTGLSDREVVKVSTFPVQVAKRKAAVIVGNSLVMQSGDALITPDPKTGLGANTAIKGARIFAKTLQDLSQIDSNGHSPSPESLEASYRNHSFASTAQAEGMVSASSKIRIQQGSNAYSTMDYAFHELSKRADLVTADEIKMLQGLLQRKRLEQPFTAEDKQALNAFVKKWDLEDPDNGFWTKFEYTSWIGMFNEELKAMVAFAK